QSRGRISHSRRLKSRSNRRRLSRSLFTISGKNRGGIEKFGHTLSQTRPMLAGRRRPRHLAAIWRPAPEKIDSYPISARDHVAQTGCCSVPEGSAPLFKIAPSHQSGGWRRGRDAPGAGQAGRPAPPAGESQPRHLARVERTAQQTLLSAQYADRFGERQNKQQQEQKQKNKKKIVAEAAAAGDRQSEQEQKKANQKPRRTAGTRPSRLEPVVSEPPKSLARLKLPIINKKNKTGNASLTMKATIAGDVSAQGGGGFPLDRMLIT
ncbi:hypothetical protein BOX15_Mlig022975g4, partial [Macrostomum lignano]